MLRKVRRWLKLHVSVRGLVAIAATALVAGIVVLTLRDTPDEPAYAPATEPATTTAAPLVAAPTPSPHPSSSAPPTPSAAPSTSDQPQTTDAPEPSAAPSTSAAPKTTSTLPKQTRHVKPPEQPTYMPGQVHG